MKILNKIVNIVLILIIFICIYNISEKLIEYNKADNSYEKIRVEKEEENLYDKYEDYRGWIKIDNTNINYPIVQGKDNSFYLDKDINKNYLSSGSIFMNYLNHGFNDENTVLFGHHMRNKTMFAQLKKYKEKEFFYGDNDIVIEVENDKVLKYKVFSAYVTDSKDNYIKTNFDDKDQYKEFLEDIKNKSQYKSDIDVNENDKIITLSTCSYEFNDARMVVHGKLLK
ncbi:MAG: class B sortase [Romboutsia timonensis]|uniref:class B sortase n=1 Tax=Romboutsia timonensis TaxID=1776391 RepID=UPI002A76672F|nr:class B sortase [Romboutsia timonensis]MDY2881481.1 class B sortase [Romboutsia timonensis]